MLLLHTCCADCALKLTSALQSEFALTPENITLFFYNPNIHPESEFHARRKALQEVFKDKGFPLVIAPWQPAHFFKALKGEQAYPKRCAQCWRLRLEHAFYYAKEQGFDQVSSTLLSSKYHDMDQITHIGNELAAQTHLQFVIPQEIDKDMCNAGFYKQNYAGCVYSLLEKLHAKYEVVG